MSLFGLYITYFLRVNSIETKVKRNLKALLQSISFKYCVTRSFQSPNKSPSSHLCFSLTDLVQSLHKDIYSTGKWKQRTDLGTNVAGCIKLGSFWVKLCINVHMHHFYYIYKAMCTYGSPLKIIIIVKLQFMNLDFILIFSLERMQTLTKLLVCFATQLNKTWPWKQY